MEILRPDLLALYQRAVACTGMADTMQTILDRDSPIWLGDDGRRLTGAEVVELPLYKAIKALARQRGIDAGLLADVPGSQPTLDVYLRRGEPN